MNIINNIAFGLGKRAHKAGLSGVPMDDELFKTHLEVDDPPIVAATMCYMDGYNRAKIKAESMVIDASDRFGK